MSCPVILEDAIAEARKLQKDRPKRAMGYAPEGEVLAQQKWRQLPPRTRMRSHAS
jgi:hypothetical protein